MLIYVGNLLELQVSDQWQEFGGRLVQLADATFSQSFPINGKPHRDHFLVNLLPSALDGAELGDEMKLSLWLDANGPIDPRDCVGRRGPMHVIHVLNMSKLKREAAARLARGVAGLQDALRASGLSSLLGVSDAPGSTEKRPSRPARGKVAATRKRDSEAPTKRGKAR